MSVGANRLIVKLHVMVLERGNNATGSAATYLRQAQTYDRARSAGRETIEPILAALADAPGRHVIDIGGGTGNYAVALARKGFDVLVLDIECGRLPESYDRDLDDGDAYLVTWQKPK